MSLLFVSTHWLQTARIITNGPCFCNYGDLYPFVKNTKFQEWNPQNLLDVPALRPLWNSILKLVAVLPRCSHVSPVAKHCSSVLSQSFSVHSNFAFRYVFPSRRLCTALDLGNVCSLPRDVGQRQCGVVLGRNWRTLQWRTSCFSSLVHF